ncbi:hypothetical protein CEXT_485041 [Caerostris extrusa]|uniref:Uncharacterized protein n=1 Tax=Caerostris extrusa TaxID=172846 RepID=A0AAV4Q7K5_CAEEX|nr:hypothetical protein CEXT_485041 [Caerostris extrusa]
MFFVSISPTRPARVRFSRAPDNTEDLSLKKVFLLSIGDYHENFPVLCAETHRRRLSPTHLAVLNGGFKILELMLTNN